MAVDKSKKWWTGDSGSDIETYLQAFSADGYPISDVVQAVCGECGGTAFGVRLDDEVDVAERTCLGPPADLRWCGRWGRDVSNLRCPRPVSFVENLGVADLASADRSLARVTHSAPQLCP